ncbi:MAG: recombination-associated protein RdgC [Deltaproteobacteria bacterium]|nr:recombination-associated protein RdgC [Deltaproteobacteria bacterium]
MGFMKGNPSVTRYRVTVNLPPDFTEEEIGERLRKQSFEDIEKTSEESSAGWVELIDDLSPAFEVGSYKFGPNYAFNLREDSRKLPAKTLNRYYNIAEREYFEKTKVRPNSVQKKELKENLRLSLLKRCLLTTDLREVVWLTGRDEVWLAGSGEKTRLLFEELWGQTFGLPVRLLVPVTMALETVPPENRDDVMGLVPGILSGEEEE